MSKNTTRKGLSFGAGLALIASGFAAVPAQAADSLVTNLASGTSFNSVAGYDNELKLSTVMSPGLASNETTLHYRISNPSGAALEIKVGNTSSAEVLVTTNQASNTGGIWEYGETAYSSVDSDTDRTGMQTSLTDFVVVPLGTKDGEADDENFITVGVVDATAVSDVTVTVTAWLDTAANASNVQDTVEVTGNTVTLNFYDKANVKATTTLVAPVTGAASVVAETVTTPELNGQQLGADFIDVAFTAQGNANAVLAENTVASNGQTKGTTTYSGTTKKWTSTAYLAYSVGADRWNGTDAAVADVNLATAINSGTWFYHNSNTTAPGATVLYTSGDSNIANKVTHGLSAGSGITHYVVYGTGVTDANVAPLAVASVSFSSAAGTVTLTDAKTASAAVASSGGTAVTQGTLRALVAGSFATVQASGVYSATPYISTTKLGDVGSSTNIGVTADDTKAVVAVSENVQGKSNADGSSATAVKVRTGTTSVTATATIYYTDADDFNRVKKAGAGVPVTGTLSSATGTFQINSAGAGVTSNVQYTDANGQVTFTVSTTTSASASNAVTLSIAPQSVAANAAGAAAFAFDWDDASYTLYDLSSSYKQPGSDASSYRFINAGGVYTYNFALVDQWGKAAPDASWRLQVVNSGRTVSSDTHALSSGRVSVNVADGAQGAGSTITTTVNVQKLVSGTWTTQATESWDGTGFGTVVINVAAASSDTITLDADAAQLYTMSAAFVSATNADLTSAIAAADVVAQDRRVSAVSQPAYTEDVVVNGRVTNKLTGVAKGGSLVTITGDSSILFSAGDVDSFGSITVYADDSGDFTFRAYSNKSMKDTVVTLTTANAGSKTVKLNFSAVGGRTGTKMTITSTSAEPGKTVVFTGLITDDYGNPIDTDQTDTNAAGATTLDAGDARLVVSYTGPGLLSGSLPVETGADGTFTVRVLLGSNDTGTATVSATYGAANGTISAADTGDNIDVKASLTVTVAPPAPPVVATKVNAGSFKGYVAIYARGYEGKRLSAKVGNDWVVVPSIVNNQENGTLFRAVEFTGAGYTIAVRIYIDRVLVDTITVTTK